MHKKQGRIFLALTAAAFLLFSCASTPKNSSNSEDEIISLGGSRRNSKSYFSGIDKNILDLVEDGSPLSLRQATSLLHNSVEEDYAENEKVLLFTAAKIMQIVWPSETVNWQVPQCETQNSYTGAIESAERGIYDYSTGNSDFLTLVLPSLVLLTQSSKTDYYKDAQIALEEALRYKEDSVLANYLLATLKFRQKDYNGALSQYKKCEAKSPETFELQCGITECCYGQNNFLLTLEKSSLLLEKYPQDLRLLELAAKSSYETGNLEKSESYVVKLLLLEPENLDYVLFRAKILMDKADYIRAAALLDVYSRKDSSAKDYLILRAKLQRDWNKNNTAAAETISKALEYYPDDEEVLLLAAQIASGTNLKLNGNSAKTLAEKLLNSDQKNLEAQQISVLEMIKSGEWQNAYNLSSEIIKTSPDTKNLCKHIEICLSLKKNQEATEIAENLYRENQNDEDVQQTYLAVLVAASKKADALSMIQSLLPTASSKMKSFLYYEKSLLDSQEEEILNDLRSSLTANPRNRDSLYRLYLIYYKKSDWRRAQYYLKQVVALDPNDTEILAKNAELDKILGR